MKSAKDFDLIDSPLKGTNLIEASAGTGKTYAITGLFLRLILEKNLSANEILVVTFTEAATEELKDRIRTRLRDAIAAFSTGEGKDEFLNALVRKIYDHTSALDRLDEAVRIFDEAGIYTIHGFCRKMLHENAFESGNLFDTELVTDQESLKKEIVEDFWRMHFYRASPLFVNYAVRNNTNPDTLLSLFGNKLAGPELKIIPELETPDTSHEERQFKKAFSEVSGAWPSAKAAVEQILATDKGLNRNQYRKNNVPGWIRSMDYFTVSGGNDPVLFDGFQKFCSGELETSMKKNCTAPDHPFFYLCEVLRDRSEDLEKVFEKRLLGLKIKLFYFLQDALKQRKQKKNIQFFDDLLLNLYQALEGKGRKALSRNIREKFKAALIDEFQDTDPIQYAIFKKVFHVPNSILFLIGDPKQAIYGFRGADIFAYMDASTHAETKYTLKENWRSEPGLISAVNAIFENAPLPFVYDEIPFHRIAPPAEKTTHELLKTGDGSSESPLQIWFLDAAKKTGTEKAINKPAARAMISQAVASEISRLLVLGTEHKATVGERPLRENDIAVLVRENAEAHMIQEALSELNIPSVLYTTENLFASHEAREMEQVLAGIARPNNERLLRVSLATDMLGVTGDQIDLLIEDENQWEKWLVKFREFHRLWDAHGFMRMFKSMALEQEISPRLMTLENGERRSTNLLHLSEVLHRAAVERKLGITGLVKWLSEKRNGGQKGDEEHQLRLESDEKAVKLVTIHRSKGLEYPVVFCPFSWGGSRSRDKKGPHLFHDISDNMRSTLDLGSEQTALHLRLAEKEMLAENLRLLYVALTRAKNRCYFVWGRFNQADTSAPAYLFHQPDSDDRDNIVNATSKNFMSLRDKDILAGLEKAGEKAQGNIRLSEMPDEKGRAYASLSEKEIKLGCREFKGKIDPQFRISSFSSLVSTHPVRAETADRDESGEPDGHDQKDLEELLRQEEPSGIFSFPKGARAGTFMHDIFEHLDFTETDASHMNGLVETKLAEYGFESTWKEIVCEMIINVLSVHLEHDQRDFTLSHIPNKNRINELGFYFPLKSISPGKLKRIFEKAGKTESLRDFPEHMGRLDFSFVSGFMKGFMDMVFQFQKKFYLVDWKSNFLGSSIAYYDQHALDCAMKEDFYILQYHIYSAALNQYLQVRLPEYSYDEHFGGVYYIFLRGIDPDAGPAFGIYRDRPSGELINALCRELIDI
ncbi:MAG: exodeoxyribonuclease V subunit beta [Deltaproteobacteria bacterium]|nr:exodeoxyribonuclease V subunit beta [Deltaproteobacteria bacterium]